MQNITNNFISTWSSAGSQWLEKHDKVKEVVSQLTLSEKNSIRLKKALKVGAIATGIMTTGYVIYSAASYLFPPTVPYEKFSDCLKFVNDHKEEVEGMYKTDRLLGRWQILGKGVWKTTYFNSAMPKCLVKAPNPYSSSSFARDVEYTHYAKKLAIENQLNRIVIPDTQLAETSKGPIIVQERLDLLNSKQVAESEFSGEKYTEAYKQLFTLVSKGEFCDIIEIEGMINAGYLKGIEVEPQIGVYDLDCRECSETGCPR